MAGKDDMSPKMEAYADLASILVFMGTLEEENPEAEFGGVKIGEAIDAFCRVSSIERYKIGSVVRALKEKKPSA